MVRLVALLQLIEIPFHAAFPCKLGFFYLILKLLPKFGEDLSSLRGKPLGSSLSLDIRVIDRSSS